VLATHVRCGCGTCTCTPRHAQDGQLAVFMGTARRQIKLLEDNIRELQRS
jgi:hypothetical protein